MFCKPAPNHLGLAKQKEKNKRTGRETKILISSSQRKKPKHNMPVGSWGALRGAWPAGRGRFSFPSTLP